MRKTKKKVTLENVAHLITDSQENLARMVANGFSAQEKTFAEKIDSAEARLSQQIGGINNRIDNLALNRATRDELLVLDKRVLRVEQKLGIDFKKPQHV